jgi:hypothetical protein
MKEKEKEKRRSPGSYRVALCTYLTLCRSSPLSSLELFRNFSINYYCRQREILYLSFALFWG